MCSFGTRVAYTEIEQSDPLLPPPSDAGAPLKMNEARTPNAPRFLFSSICSRRRLYETPQVS